MSGRGLQPGDTYDMVIECPQCGKEFKKYSKKKRFRKFCSRKCMYQSRLKPIGDTQICTQCDNEKPRTNEYFVKSAGKRGGFREICKECQIKRGKRKRSNNCVRDGKKKCGECGKVKDVIDFNPKTVKNCLTYESLCKTCSRLKNNKDNRKRWKNNSEFRERQKQARRKLWNEDAGFRIRCNLSRRINHAIKKGKTDSTLELLGCTIDELREHLEAQFKDGMTWNNYGNPNGDHTDCWHIDHIKPCALFDLEDIDQQKECFHYTNLQPLWSKENMSKGARCVG